MQVLGRQAQQLVVREQLLEPAKLFRLEEYLHFIIELLNRDRNQYQTHLIVKDVIVFIDRVQEFLRYRNCSILHRNPPLVFIKLT